MPDGDERAGCQADEVVSVRQGPRFIEVVNAPDQATFGVAPGAEVLDVQVAHGEHDRSDCRVADRGAPCRGPPIERGAQEGKAGRAHRAMLVLEIRSDERYPGR